MKEEASQYSIVGSKKLPQFRSLSCDQPPIIYEKNNKVEKVCDEYLIQKLERLQINNEPKYDNENDCFKYSVAKSLLLNTQTRYFQGDLFSFCYLCKKIGHVQRQCTSQNQEFCIYCLKEDHYSHHCKQVACFKCHLKGHRKAECKTKIQINYRPILVTLKHFDQIQCLNCLQLGHITCELNLDNDFVY
ncbi:unnamed protein product (macronuclear) [Paramecium tetraurelia]|uniref:CCHC-type domain-containing protein n=1 Tax=Paramecium tetraurelia TaxID=5888 RepID=A0CVR9_PARTE|nr:uncharacterized protein GSPATT00039047001 [Paramecium tetraurelia]CAK74886.1 unnamed protein product [Paramecium tetraurelia]|eukprot:XP_001442283.1 hypothetical protein (macronuclear) [Paramecium tetraurelia strain d4-2]